MATLKTLVNRIARRNNAQSRQFSAPTNTDMESNFAALGGCPDDEYVVRHLYDVAGFYGDQKAPPQD